MARTMREPVEAVFGGSVEQYVELVRAFPPVHIRGDEHLAAAMEMVDRLLDKDDLSQVEEMYLETLTDLIETYEDAHIHIPQRSGIDALRFLMEANDMKQSDLIPVLGRKSLVSELLNGKRPLALAHIKKIAGYFKVSPAVFID